MRRYRPPAYLLWIAINLGCTAAQWNGLNQTGEMMRIDMNRFSFESPKDFEDVTSYTFKDPHKMQELTVSFGTPPKEAGNLRRLMALRRGNLDLIMPGAVKIEKESETRVDGLPARMLSFTFEDRGQDFCERWAVALPAPDLYLQISYVALASDTAAEHRFSHMLESVVPAKRAAPPAQPGYVRRWAKRMSLDVPVDLYPPPIYQFVDRENSEVRLLLQYHDPEMTGRPMPSTHEDEAQDAAVGAIQNRQVRTIAIESGVATVTSYSTAWVHGDQTWVGLGDLTLPNGVQIHVSIRGPLGFAARMESTITSLMRSMTVK